MAMILLHQLTKKRTNVLIDWLKLDICYKTTVAKKPPACPSLWYYILRSLLAWLTDSDKDPNLDILKLPGYPIRPRPS
ncbi:hypothetical protein F2Q69_00002774 [Brassica cretica]|uniref:Uncharacterized protein n=1 Tax=Brassica cretica TaxID=69181 RepID=A0A8S9PCD0_BRACR|nr:hypothetical protein F2Q69_00002774 [Brassica cretica]